jgi:hypothetical protein
MSLRFIAPDPRQRARPLLDSVLTSGTDQIAIACAFLTRGGVQLLRRHSPRLRLPSSFVVVAWEHPTDLEALNELYDVMPGNLYVHLGSLTPKEHGVGPGLMHSKVFLANAGGRYSLWVGSHNLTASAAQGVNCEGALLVEGATDEQVYLDALQHLNRCRAEAIAFDPRNPPPPLRPVQTLVIHAERHAVLRRLPWHVHFLPATTDYDKAMRPPAAVWLYLYEPGSLRPGRPRPAATTAHSGTLTALNFTETHPRFPGISAAWNSADYVIDLVNGIPCLREPTPHHVTPSQGIFRVSVGEDPQTVWLTESPEPKIEREVGVRRVSEVDPEYRQYFSKDSIVPEGLLHNEFRTLKTTVRLPRKEIGNMREPDLQRRFFTNEEVEVSIDEELSEEDLYLFIYRAKFRA